MVGQHLSVPVLSMFKQFITRMGSPHFVSDSIIVETDIFSQPSLLFNQSVISNNHAILILNSNLKLEAPLLNARFRELSKTIPIFSLGFNNASFIQNLGPISTFYKIFSGVNKLTKLFSSFKSISIICGNNIALDKRLASPVLHSFINLFIENGSFISLFNLPQNLSSLATSFLNYRPKLNIVPKHPTLLYLLEAEAFAFNPIAYDFVVYQGSHGDKGAQYANLILPTSTLYESFNNYTFSIDGTINHFHNTYTAPKEARTHLSILSSLTKFLDLPSLIYSVYDWKRIYSVQAIMSNFRLVFEKKTGLVNLTHNFHLNDFITRASPTLALASLRFKKHAEVRNNFIST